MLEKSVKIVVLSRGKIGNKRTRPKQIHPTNRSLAGHNTVNERTSLAMACPLPNSRLPCRNWRCRCSVENPRRGARKKITESRNLDQERQSIDQSLHMCAGVKVIIRSFVTVFFFFPFFPSERLIDWLMQGSSNAF